MVRFLPDPTFKRDAAKSPEVQAVLVARAEAGKSFAERVAPVDTGEYRRSFRVEVTGGQVRLVNISDHAVFVETKNGDRVLARAIDIIEKG